MMNAAPDAIVIGGGVIGCSIAYHLAKAGVKTTLLERERIGMEASNAASGVLSSMFGNTDEPYMRLVNDSLAMFHTLAPELAEASGIDIEFAQCGELTLAFTEAEAETLYAAFVEGEWQSEDALWLSSSAIRDREPEITETAAGAVYVPDVCRVNNQRLSDAYARAAAQLGADIRQHSEVIGLIRSGLRITGVRLHNDELAADHTIIAAGAWSPHIAEWVGGDVPVRPVRGVNLNLQPAGRSIKSVIHGGWGLLVPRNDGTIIAGATVDEAGFDCRVTGGAVQDILEISTQIIPSLRDARLNWSVAGLRPGSPDDAPILGAVPGWRGLHVAAGHYRSGILLSAVTGKLMAEHITDKDPDLIEHFTPRRFR